MKTVRIILMLMIAAFSAKLFADPIEGYWKSIDEKDKKVTAVWKFDISGGELRGTIVKIPGKPDTEVATAFKGDLQKYHGVKIIGTYWLYGMKQDGSSWSGGKIIDSKEGKIYKCKMWVEEGNLKVRGYMGPFYRTQEWKRASESDAK